MMRKNIIISPHITEKSMQLASSNKYTFIVDKSASKPEIEKAIQYTYKYTPIHVDIINHKGKNIIFKHKHSGQRKNYKKAIVSLKPKDKIKEFIIKEK
jgi:large subunit ribosomal protein L23